MGHGLGSAGSLYRGLPSPPVIHIEVTGRGQELRLRKLPHHSGGGRMATSRLQLLRSLNEEEADINEGIELLRFPFRAEFLATH